MSDENKNLKETEETKVKKAPKSPKEKKVKSEKVKKEKKFNFHMPSSLFIIIGVLFATIILTWIVSWTGGSATTDTGEVIYVHAMGLLTFGSAMSSGFGDASSLIFYLFVLGAVIELMLVSGSLEAGVNSIVRAFKGKELLLIPILMFLFSAGGTIYGMQEETLGLFVIIVPTIALAGFDTVTGLLIILLGTTTGFAASTVNPFSVGAVESAVGNSEIFVMGDGLIFRLVWWLMLTVVSISFVTLYAWYVKKNPEKTFNKANKEEADKWLEEFRAKEGSSEAATTRQKIALAIFMSSFLIMIVMFIPWTSLFNFEYNYDIPNWISWLIGGLNGPGEWYFEELSMLFIVAGILIAIVLNMGVKESSKVTWSGAKEMFSVAIIIGVARSIPYILNESGAQLWLVDALTGGLSGMSPLAFIYVIFFIFLVLTLVIPSTSGLASATMGLIMPVAVSIGGPEIAPAVVMVFVLATGIVNMFVPTQAVVMASCSSSRVSYGDAMKPVMSFALVLVVITLAGIIPSTLMFGYQ